MSRRLAIAALVMVLSGALAACFSTPGYQSGQGGDDDSADGSGVDANGTDNGDGGVDSDKIYDDAPRVYNDAPKYYMDGPSPCIAGKPGSIICSNM